MQFQPILQRHDAGCKPPLESNMKWYRLPKAVSFAHAPEHALEHALVLFINKVADIYVAGAPHTLGTWLRTPSLEISPQMDMHNTQKCARFETVLHPPCPFPGPTAPRTWAGTDSYHLISPQMDTHNTQKCALLKTVFHPPCPIPGPTAPRTWAGPDPYHSTSPQMDTHIAKTCALQNSSPPTLPLSRPHCSMYLGRIWPQLLNISSGGMPSSRHRICTKFSYLSNEF